MKIRRLLVDGKERFFTAEGREIGLIDMDGVSAHLFPEWFRMYNEEYEDNLTSKDIHSWDYHRYVKEACGTKIYDYFKKPGLFRTLKMVERASEVLERMSDRYEFFIVSDSPPGHAYDSLADQGANPADDKREWVREHFPFIARENIIFTSKKYMVCGSFLVDDGPPNLNEWHKLGRTAICMDLDYGWTRQVLPDIPRIHGWGELEETVARLLPPI